MALRSTLSRSIASEYNRCDCDDCASSAGIAEPSTSAAATHLPKLRIDFLEVRTIDQHLARFATRAGRDESFGLHHVDQTSRAAESDAQLPLQVRDRHLAAADDDPCGLVVEIVLLEFHPAGAAGLLVLLSDRVVEHRFPLLAEKAGQPRALLLGDVGPVQTDRARGCGRKEEHVAFAEQLL